MTANDSAGGVLGDLTAAGATAAWKIANVVLGGCGLTHAGADLQGFGNLGDGAKPLYASNSGPVSNGRLANAGVATTQICDLPKENADQVKMATVKPIIGRINAPRLPNGRYQKLQSPALLESSSACPSPTTCSTAVAATWTNAPDATSTSLTTSSPSSTPSSSDLASLIYSTFSFDQLKSNTNLELNLHKNLFCKLNYSQLISFLDTTLSAQPHSYKSLNSLISFALRFLVF